MPSNRKLASEPIIPSSAILRTPNRDINGPTDKSAGIRPRLCIPIRVPYCSADSEKSSRIRVPKTGNVVDAYAVKAFRQMTVTASLRRSGGWGWDDFLRYVYHATVRFQAKVKSRAGLSTRMASICSSLKPRRHIIGTILR